MGERTRSALRISAYVDPVAVIGIALSIVVSVVLDLTKAATGVESFLCCTVVVRLAVARLSRTTEASRP
jgi:hypothetical protein